MTNQRDSSPAETAAPQDRALRTIEKLTRRYLEPGQPVVAKAPSEEAALLKTVHDLALAGLGKASRDEAPTVACSKCGRPHGRTTPWNGEPEELCEACETLRIEEIHRIAEHHDRHPGECCCETYLGRACCMAPLHGDVYRAHCIENGERFVTDFRAKNHEEALELGKEHAADWGGECLCVRKLRQTEAA